MKGSDQQLTGRWRPIRDRRSPVHHSPVDSVRKDAVRMMIESTVSKWSAPIFFVAALDSPRFGIMLCRRFRDSEVDRLSAFILISDALKHVISFLAHEHCCSSKGMVLERVI